MAVASPMVCQVSCHHFAGAQQLGRDCHQWLEQALHLRADRRAPGHRVVL
jgi:hypothetical protein